jgi:hypothetical protein
VRTLTSLNRIEARYRSTRTVRNTPSQLEHLPDRFESSSVNEDPVFAGKVHGLALNRVVCSSYSSIANQLQNCLEGDQRNAMPNWFSLATLASKEVGEGMRWANWALGEESKTSREAKQLVNEMVWDPRTLAISVCRFLALTSTAPLGQKIEATASTLRNFLEDGSSQIYRAVTPTAHEYLAFRQKNPAATASEVLTHLANDPTAARQVYLDGRIEAESNQDVMAAAMALFHQASQAQPVERDALIRKANQVMLQLEQQKVLPAAYASSDPSSAEVDRTQLMQLLTPFLTVDSHWSYSDYAKKLPDLDGSILTPPATERNWANFADRWPAILDFAEQCYKVPSQVWTSVNR